MKSKCLKLLPTLAETIQMPASCQKVYFHFYNPIGAGDWFVMGGEKVGNDWRFYGVIILTKRRWDYFTLSEMEKKRVTFWYKNSDRQKI